MPCDIDKEWIDFVHIIEARTKKFLFYDRRKMGVRKSGPYFYANTLYKIKSPKNKMPPLMMRYVLYSRNKRSLNRPKLIESSKLF